MQRSEAEQKYWDFSKVWSISTAERSQRPHGERSATHQPRHEGQLTPCESGPGSNHKHRQGLGAGGPPRQACLQARPCLQAVDAQPHAASMPRNRAHVQRRQLRRQEWLWCLQAPAAPWRLRGGSHACPPHTGRQEPVCGTGPLWFMSPLRRPLPGRDIQSGAGDGSHSSSKTQFLSFWWNKWYSLSKGGYKNMCLKRMSGTGY